MLNEPSIALRKTSSPSQFQSHALIADEEKPRLQLQARQSSIGSTPASYDRADEPDGSLEAARYLPQRAGYAVVGFAEPVQRHLGASGPLVVNAKPVPLQDEKVVSLPANVIGLQIEIAFKLGKDFPSLCADIGMKAVLEVIEGIYPALVFVTSGRQEPVVGTAARVEHGATFAIDPTPVACLDLRGDLDIRAALHRNGIAIWDVTSVLRCPLNALMWAAEQLFSDGIALRKGDVVTTGTFPFLFDAKCGDQLEAILQGNRGRYSFK